MPLEAVVIGKHLPDPLHAHGAWVYLSASVAVGALAAPPDHVLPALLAGAGTTGAFMVCGSLWGHRRRVRPLLIGAAVALCGPLLALLLGAEPVFLAFAGFAALPALAAVLFARVYGSLSLPAIVGATLAIAISAPVAASAGGMPIGRSLLLLSLLAPFFAWRTVHVRTALTARGPHRTSPKAAGLREARHAAVWCALVVLLSHVL